MTPDMKRLCDEAKFAYDEVTQTPHGLAPYEAEAIVRAVLTALREPSESLESACSGIVTAAGGDNWDIDHKADEMRAAMIDHILSGPATA